MTYPYYRALFCFFILLAAFFGLLIGRPQSGRSAAPSPAPVHHFDIRELQANATPNTVLQAAKSRPLFNPGRKRFAAPPTPVATPAQEANPIVESPLPVAIPEVTATVTPVLPTENTRVPLSKDFDSSTLAPLPILTATNASAAELGLSLKGIVFSGDSRRALVVSKALPSGAWLKPGEQISGWTLGKIEREAVTLSSGATNTKLQLYVDNFGKRLGLKSSQQ